jgi:hypothetical protein
MYHGANVINFFVVEAKIIETSLQILRVYANFSVSCDKKSFATLAKSPIRQNGLIAEASLLNKRSSSATALGLTKFKIIIDINLDPHFGAA